MTFFALPVACCLIVSGDAQRQDPSFTAKSHYFGFFAGRSELVLGTDDPRFGGGFFYEYGRPEPKLKFLRVPAQHVSEFYMDRTHSHGANGELTNDSYAAGVLEIARMRFKSAFFDVGWGLQAQNRATTDVPSYINSTPIVGTGFVFHAAHADWFTGVRWLHISNAGTMHRNPGQNELFLMLGVRY